MMMRKRISYTLNSNDPGWPGNPKIGFASYTSIAEGDSCNQYILSLFNHFGSHMDGARHFNDNGIRLAEEDFDRFFYGHPLLVDIPKKAAEAVIKEDLVPYAAEIAKADLLMIRTGFSKIRRDDPEIYSAKGPYMDSDAAKYLMDHFRSNLKAVALDFISLGSPAAPDGGGLAHQYMLGVHHHGEHICIIEDVNFEGLESEKLRSAAAVPLFTEIMDSAQVTMWVETD